MTKDHIYVGIHDDHFGGMTPIGTIIRDAWLFEILPEDEDCAGWEHGRLQAVYDKVSAAWAPYGHLASRLPPELAERHARINAAAIRRARELGWNPELADDD